MRKKLLIVVCALLTGLGCETTRELPPEPRYPKMTRADEGKRQKAKGKSAELAQAAAPSFSFFLFPFSL